jgi:hypothetical protein
MSRVIAILACGASLAACSASMPSMDFLRGSPATEQLRIESEPPGADARTSQGQSCRTPCELSVASGSEFTVTVAMNGYQPQTIPVRAEAPLGSVDRESSGQDPHLQPNPVYVELQAITPAKKRPAPAKKNTASTRRTPSPTQAAGSPVAATGTTYPWPAPQ